MIEYGLQFTQFRWRPFGPSYPLSGPQVRSGQILWPGCTSLGSVPSSAMALLAVSELIARGFVVSEISRTVQFISRCALRGSPPNIASSDYLPASGDIDQQEPGHDADILVEVGFTRQLVRTGDSPGSDVR